MLLFVFETHEKGRVWGNKAIVLCYESRTARRFPLNRERGTPQSCTKLLSCVIVSKRKPRFITVLLSNRAPERGTKAPGQHSPAADLHKAIVLCCLMDWDNTQRCITSECLSPDPIKRAAYAGQRATLTSCTTLLCCGRRDIHHMSPARILDLYHIAPHCS